jgi:6-pyruvoyltetrahydropterin/6-carboxytetrahydropterin synthase
VEFDMGHRLPGYSGQCKHLHGHRYVLLATVKGDPQSHGSEEGMVLDFKVMKEAMQEVVSHLDHKMMLHRDDPLMQYYRHQYGSRTTAQEEDGILEVPFIPTAENIAAMILQALRTSPSATEVEWVKVVLYETPSSSAEVRAWVPRRFPLFVLLASGLGL